MITLLSLKDFVIVPELVIEAEKGLTCLTGETGAGKSILIDALQLVLGGRSDAGVIREGCEKCEVGAEFDISDRARIWLDAHGFDTTGSILMRRTVDTKGRSRCWINGSPATVSQMKELGERLVDIHGQHAHQSLMRQSYQLQLVDGFGVSKLDLINLKKSWDAWQNASARLKEATEEQDKLQSEAERLNWMIEVLDELAPKENEWDEISREHALLSNCADIILNVRTALEYLREDDTNALRLVNLAQMELTSASRFDKAYGNFADALEQAGSLIDEASREISRYVDKFDMDEERLSVLDERLNAYWRLSRKFHRQPQELYELWQQTKDRISQIEASSDIPALKRREEKAREDYYNKAAIVTRARQNAAGQLSEAITAEMQGLSMAGGRFEVALAPCQPWAGGVERCEYLVSGHAGATPRSLTKVASGGELARISLAIAVITARITPVPTMIFDEVDTGIGGAVAEVVGNLLRRLGNTRQVLCVTHLPQVASCAHNQWKVHKSTSDGVTTSKLTVLGTEERIDEVARMLGGMVITDAARSAARELIEAHERSDAGS